MRCCSDDYDDDEKIKHKRGKKRRKEIFDNNVLVFSGTWCDMLNVVDTFISNAFLMLFIHPTPPPFVCSSIHSSTISLFLHLLHFMALRWAKIYTLSHPFTRKVCMEFRAYVSFWPTEWFKLLHALRNKTKQKRIHTQKYINTTAAIVKVYSRITEHNAW